VLTADKLRNRVEGGFEYGDVVVVGAVDNHPIGMP
jgi:hypothetical protein